MVCYARPAGRMAALLLVVFLVFGRSVGHFLDATALVVAIAIFVGVAAVAAAVAFAVFGSVRRRRAAAGGCVGCQFSCQHAMVEEPRRLLPVVSPVVNTVSQRAPDAPRWPDRPAYRSSPAVLTSWPGTTSRPVAARPGTVTGPPVRAAGRRERAGSAVLTARS
jgi:hypothetical protein